MIDKALLTIAIPTYNRGSYIDLCLKRIAEEIIDLDDNLKNLVYVNIFDNASTDETSGIVNKYINLNVFNINYQINAINIGADLNISQCYKSASTPYVWIMGDDDVILRGKLRVILNALRDKTVDVLYLNGYGYCDSYLDEPSRGKGRCGVTTYSSSLNFVRRINVMLTFITSLIVRGGIDINSIAYIVDGSKLHQLSWVCTSICEGTNFWVIEDRVYAAKIANSGGYGAVDVFGRQLCEIVDIFFKKNCLSKAVKNGVILMWFPTCIMDMRMGKSQYDYECIDIELSKVFFDNWRYNVFLWPLIYLPLGFAKIYFQFIRIVRKFMFKFLI